MKKAMKYTAAVALTGALALAAATPSRAWHGHHGGGAAAIGFGVGALAGAAIASSAYNNGYYYGYDYAPGYYAPGYAYDTYAYEPAPVYGYYDNWSYQHSTNNFSIDSQR
ncbi:MAG TPA: hypothetical protein VJR71_16200 [Pseudolabrys sp.]|nr:hypothetical protein [Pseudolabrys sp.]